METHEQSSIVDVVVDTSSLRRSEVGSVTGRVCLRSPAGDFPESSWTDFPVTILTWWISGLTDVVAGKELSFRGLFMDGPFAFVVRRGKKGSSGRIGWGTTGEENWIGIVDIAVLLRSAVAAGRLVAQACCARNWSSRDLEDLERAIVRSAV